MKITNDQRGLYNTDNKEDSKYNVDEIFARADAQMESQKTAIYSQNRKFRNSIKKIKRRAKISFIAMLILAILTFCGIGIYSVFYGVKIAKNEIVMSLIDSRHNILSQEPITLEDELAHKLFTIITDEDIISMVDKTTSLSTLKNLFEEQQLLSDGMLDPEKQAQLKELFEEYNKTLYSSDKAKPSILDEIINETESESQSVNSETTDVDN